MILGIPLVPDRTRLKLERKGYEQTVELNGTFFLNNVGAIHKAVLDGAGIHAGPRWLFDEALASGELVELLEEWSLPALPVHLVRLKGRYVPQRVELLCDWIAQCWAEARFPE
ncbi:putative transcriptional regulator [Pseudomonas cichorii]|uniref:Putative transcriptional regulator n=1 Tax=Pseudomonas cichorii TaxID=36746 RepID=A0A3M4M9D3_PSECI|nr:putative transcriptional regulator [Pseudomonas cichorii]